MCDLQLELFNCLLKLLSLIELVQTNNIQLPSLAFQSFKMFHIFLFCCSLVLSYSIKSI